MYEAHVVHHIPGRIRLKVPVLKGASDYSQQINDLLLPIEGIRQVDFSPITGSVLLHYDPERHEHFSKDLAAHVQRSLGFNLVSTTSNNGSTDSKIVSNDVVAPVVQDTKVAREISSFLSHINEQMRTATGGAFDLKALLPVSLGLYALFRIASPATTPLWVTLGIFSFTSFAILNPTSVTVVTEPQQRTPPRRKTTPRKSKASS